MPKFIILESVLSEIEKHSLGEAPRECCGMLAGRDSRAVSRYPLRNLAENPHTAYFAAPEDIFVAMRRMRESGEELIAIYHSHPSGKPYPSQTDLEMAFYPNLVYLITALNPVVETRAFSLCNNRITDIELVASPLEHRSEDYLRRQLPDTC